MSADRATELGYEGESGVLITKVARDKIAYEKGMREGMMVLKVDKKPVKNVEEFKSRAQRRSR